MSIKGDDDLPDTWDIKGVSKLCSELARLGPLDQVQWAHENALWLYNYMHYAINLLVEEN